MAEDVRLFAANSPIGRLWYYINLFILGILAIGARIGVKDYLLPHANSSYELPIKFILYFIYFILAITFLMLIDRRIHDISGSRDSTFYKLVSRIIGLIVFLFIATGIGHVLKISAISAFSDVIIIFSIVFVVIIFLLGLIPGKLTSK